MPGCELPSPPVPLAASADFRSPLFWAVFVAWIMSVVLHEFAHGLVAHLGGDYTIRDRGGLTLNPIQYIHPLYSLLLPALFLLMGGFPLPGGATYVRTDLLRNRAWRSAVALAGPAMNGLLFLACALPLHPRLGWASRLGPEQWTPAQKVLATCAVLQVIAVLLSLAPVPPLDGFQAVSPYISPRLSERLMAPPANWVLLVGFYLVLRSLPPEAWDRVFEIVDLPFRLIGFDERARYDLHRAYNLTLLGRPA